MRRGGSVLFLLCVIAAVFASCAQENAPAGLGNPLSSSAADASAPAPKGPRVCEQTHAESLPARLVAMSTHASSGANVVLVSDLFQQFKDVCGSCHGPTLDQGQGGFQITGVSGFNMPSGMTWATVLPHITQSVCPNTEDKTNPNDPMPPCGTPTGKTYASRSTTNDPVYLFAQAITEWIAAGQPPSFTPGASSVSGGDAGATSAFTLTPQDGNAMTNIGNCVPGLGLMGLLGDSMAALDKKFAAATSQPGGTAAQIIGLPEHLSETDLVSLDSATLAQTGVIAYAPGYPLWSDNAGKLRYVRVPQGQSIHFNKTTQQFEIPPNTRFYKTFMKQIIDTDGSYRYRKIETRLIVSRPDENNPDGTALAQTALYGTYRWRADESDADLIETPLNNGEPFSDTLLLYNTNEPLAADILKAQPAEPNLALLQAGAARDYAIPSSARCVQCHMGSPSQSFILGFTPLQINRRPTGWDGVIEEAGPDELTQLQRLIDAGFITGIDSPDDVLLLEQSQGSRTPRNYNELTAQGYMLGNCAHCHNPRGFPTIQNPVLQGVLDFLPDPTFGGIFQFPLESYSPRIGRGSSGTEPIPYITPSLVDLPRTDPQSGLQAGDVFVIGTNSAAHSAIYGPWRSIIYRNVDAAFAYVDDLALYPHMPMNTPGYDPRAKAIFADWMVSIPAVRKHPELLEYAYRTDGDPADNSPTNAVPDTSYQPYVEVLPGTPDYEAASLAATLRLQILHTGINAAVPLGTGAVTYIRYTDPGLTDDILDPAVLENPICTPVPQRDPTSVYPFPNHPHWVSTDLTDPPPPWAPRQPNWPDVLAHDNVPPIGSGCTSPAALLRAHADEVIAVGLLPKVTLGQACDFLTTPRPFGLWQQQPGCDFSSQPTVKDFAGAQRPDWMAVTNPPPDAPVFQQTPGAAVFKMICINCHGPRADASGRLAQNLATMTGGGALVANFRDGLFGPVGSTELASNRHAQFGTAQLPNDEMMNPDWTGSVTDDDRAARYMAWMGLGGTSVNIPIELLQIVAVTKVIDQQRVLSANSLSANMLSQAKALCLSILGPGFDDQKNNPQFIPGLGNGYLDVSGGLNSTLIHENGDAELWLGLCARNNPHPIEVLKVNTTTLHLDVPSIDNNQGALDIDNSDPFAMVAADAYPPMTPVGNDRGGVDANLCVDAATCSHGGATSCTSTSCRLCSLPGQANCEVPNLWPWCIDPASVAGDKAAIAWVAANGYPLCPASVMNGTYVTNDYANQWSVRGAINAGLAVFKYVESIENTTPPPDFNQCAALATSTAAPPSNPCSASP
jgi:mono/diheme cytochrome c family protein